jgi:serine/threonine protein phosphatase PrpC
MEDAHISKFNIAPDTHIFGVFDGHGGRRLNIFSKIL